MVTCQHRAIFNILIHCVAKKCRPFYFFNKSVKNKLIIIIFGTWTYEET